MDTRIVSWNTNGLRSTLRREPNLSYRNIDLVLLQEVRASKLQIEALHPHILQDHKWFWNSGDTPGHFGVATGISHKLLHLNPRVLEEFSDADGRVLVVELGSTVLVNAYVPAKGWGEYNDTLRVEFLSDLTATIRELEARGYAVILGGDLNSTPDDELIVGLDLVDHYSGEDATKGNRRIDYILTSSTLSEYAGTASVLPFEISDHKPVELYLTLPEE